MERLSLFRTTEHGDGLIEYVLIITLIALVAVAAIKTVGTKLSTDFTSVGAKL